ncbi:MAG TPA: heavy-metal-associated domain-containing protein [Granulicella sp.]|jgi:copper chaperone|nr:heavy-metal-associated domain-containing protein [Granulicella sp.]
MQDTLQLSIEGMHCGACVRRVTTALAGVAGVEVGSVEVGSAKLAFDPAKASAQEIVTAVTGIGFAARIAQ